MIAYIKGVLAEAEANTIAIETAGGVAYEISVMSSDAERLPSLGEEIKLYTYLQVKEDGVALFGFLSKADLAVFRLLLTVSGVGPKSGLAILSALGVTELRLAVMTEDADRIAAAPGVGKKTAGRLIIELKDKLAAMGDVLAEEFLEKTESVESVAGKEEKALRDNALQVLVALGYAQREAAGAVGRVAYTEGMTEDDMVRLSLRELG